MQTHYESYININKILMFMEQDVVIISKKEYEGMKETIEILQNPDVMNQILESEKNITKNKIKKLSI